MIDWIHEDCLVWGDYMRKTPRAWPSKSITWKLFREKGAGKGEQKKTNPEWDWPKQAMFIHRSYRAMPDNLRNVMDVCYGSRGDKKRKAKKLNMSIAKMYQYRSHCHYFIVGRIPVEEKVV